MGQASDGPMLRFCIDGPTTIRAPYGDTSVRRMTGVMSAVCIGS